MLLAIPSSSSNHFLTMNSLYGYNSTHSTEFATHVCVRVCVYVRYVYVCACVCVCVYNIDNFTLWAYQLQSSKQKKVLNNLNTTIINTCKCTNTLTPHTTRYKGTQLPKAQCERQYTSPTITMTTFIGVMACCERSGSWCKDTAWCSQPLVHSLDHWGYTDRKETYM